MDNVHFTNLHTYNACTDPIPYLFPCCRVMPVESPSSVPSCFVNERSTVLLPSCEVVLIARAKDLA